MIKFIGEHTAKLDDKGRLIFPSAFKTLIESEGDLRLVVRKATHGKSLEIYTYQEWENLSEGIKARLNLISNEKHNLFWNEFTRNRTPIEPAGKLGRITISKRLLEEIGVVKDVIFCGSDHKINLWAKENFELNRMSDAEFAALASEILG